jgi:hypothetical protein
LDPLIKSERVTLSRGCERRGRESFVGSEMRAACDRAEAARWQSVANRLAIYHANYKSVLSDFNNAAFDYYDVYSRHHDPRLMSWS